MLRALYAIAIISVPLIFSTSAAQADPFFSGPNAGNGKWTFTGSLHTARISPVAVTLPSGKVLVTGGFNNPNSFATSELWDPGTGKWSPTGSMSVDRVGASDRACEQRRYAPWRSRPERLSG